MKQTHNKIMSNLIAGIVALSLLTVGTLFFTFFILLGVLFG